MSFGNTQFGQGGYGERSSVRSHRLQTLLNYFDARDQRVREVGTTIDAQLLNTAALALDDFELRLLRETEGRVLGTVPAGLDNLGVYYGSRVPAGFILPEEGSGIAMTVEGRRGTQWSVLPLFDDRLPLPARVEVDSSRESVPLTDPVVVDMQGQGVNSILHASPGTLLFPNQLSLWLEGYGLTGTIDVVLEGSPYPQAAWPTERSIVRERLTLTREGLTITRNAWSSLSNVTVRGLPTGARLRIWMLPVSLPMLYDGLRPYADAGFRDKLFDRYWSIENDDRLLVERYWASSYGGFEYVNSYKLNQDLTGLAIEPLTWGMWTAAGSQLFYSDRRELMPDLSDTGLTSEPLWGMKLEYADDRHGAVRSLRITPIQYPSAGAMTMHRYVVRDPEGSDFVLSATGALQDYTGSGGWDTSWPKSKVMPMSKTGTYQITLECRDGAGNLRVDTQPYRNAELLSLASFDLGSQLASIDGLAFDYLGQLWAWTGSMAVPLSVSYDAYVLDRDINSIFTTDQFDELRIS